MFALQPRQRGLTDLNAVVASLPPDQPGAPPPSPVRPVGGLFAHSARAAQKRAAGVGADGLRQPDKLETNLATANNLPIAVPGLKDKSPGFDWRRAAGTLGAYLLSMNGNPLGAQLMSQMSQRERLAFEAEQEERERRLRLMEPQHVGNSLVQPDGRGGYRTLFTAPQPWEIYARQFGEPGTREYVTAMEDYILRGSGDTALTNKSTLEGVRYGYRDELQDQRLAQSDLNNRRTTSTSRENNIRTTTTSRENAQLGADTTRRGQDMTDKRVRDSAAFKGAGRSRLTGGYPEGTIISNGSQKMIRRNGQWVPHNQ